jgi:hypothetical protein
MTIFFACFIRNSNHEKETAEYIHDDFNLALDEEHFSSIEVCVIP